MPRDILFREDDFVFSYRVGGIALRGGHVLLQRPKGDDFAIIGGHVGSMETAEQALIREFGEELHTEIKVGRLLATAEIFFPWGDKPCHQICFYYLIDLPDDAVPLGETVSGYDEWGSERLDLDFCWVPLDELRKGVKVYPLELIPCLLDPPCETVHFVSREI